MKNQWQQEMIESFRTLSSLLEFLNISNFKLTEELNKSPQFPLIVPKSFAEKMKKGKRTDPLLLQVLPKNLELINNPSFTSDPVGDFSAKTENGIIHKYKNRVLLPITGNCAINCRYCFRQHYPYEETTYNSERFKQSLNYIIEHPKINEVILSGGDPLSLSDATLESILNELNNLEQISVIRFHTRFPVVIPSRLTKELSHILSQSNKQLIFVFHINHPNEIDEVFQTQLNKFRTEQMICLNQAVLLKDINNSALVLSELSKKLVSYGILPYYLNQLDKVSGATHFEVPIEEGKQLVSELRKTLSGYMIPRYIQEISGETSKRIIL